MSGIKHVIVDVDLEGLTTKKDLDSFALKTSLSSLKTEVDELDIPKLSTVPADLAKLTKEVQEDFTKKTDFNTLKTKVDNNESDNDNLETKVDNNHLTAEPSINNLKTKVDGIDLTKYIKKVTMTLKLVI